MKKEKTIYELAKEFPNKSYSELEIYRDADRNEEAAKIPLTESQKSQEDLEPIAKGVCVTGTMRKHRTSKHKVIKNFPEENMVIMEGPHREKSTESEVLIETYEKDIWKLKQLLSKAMQDTNTLEGTKRIVIEISKEKTVLKKRAQEAEGELSILKGIETNRVKESQARSNQLQDELDRVKKENNGLFNKVADALEVNESHQKLNGKLQERLTELEEENKKLNATLNKKIDDVRKAGL